ncbi:hypothetical protein fugu_005444 [Takifugu bimaculatus]|nr:hypothetical protein fugu_005444 [Takifugu bimaculatus]
MVPASGRAGSKKTPALVTILSWLAPHIRHRDMASRCDAKSTSPTETRSQPELPVSTTQPSSSSTLTTSTSSDSSPEHSSTSSLGSGSAPESSPLPICSTPHAPALSAADMVPFPPQSPVAHPGKRRKKERDEWVVGQINQLEEHRLELTRTVPEFDEYTRFGLTLADMLRKVPEDKRDDLMFKLYSTVYKYRRKL